MTFAPYIHCRDNLFAVYAEKIIALLPALLWAYLHFPIRCILLVLMSCLTCTVLDLLWQEARCLLFGQGRPWPDPDLPLIGLLLGMTFPSEIAVWVVLVGDLLAVLLFRNLPLLGGFRPILPVAASHVLLQLITKDFTLSFALSQNEPIQTALDQLMDNTSPDYMMLDIFLGKVPGAIGEVSGLLLVLGGCYLLIRHQISWEIPVASILSLGVLALLLAPDSVAYYTYVGDQIFSGGLLFCSLFVVTDACNLPVSSTGKILCGLLLGAFTFLCRRLLHFEGVYLAALIVYLLAPLIEKLTLPAPFGGKTQKSKKNI
jgi:electron transport complex protein RnfD